MKSLVIGSTAAAAAFPHWRRPKDLDVLADHEIPDADVFWDERLAPFIKDGVYLASPDELYTVKLSHAAWALSNGSWEKHMHDCAALKDLGAEVWEDFYAALYLAWTDKHGAKKVDLDMDKAAFFDDAVRRQYDHDSVHRSVAYGAAPMYERFLKSGSSVQMDMAAVWAAPLEDQIALFREEIYATALERWIIPSGYTTSPRLAYARALKKTVTSLTKGRSSRFIAENYGVFCTPDIDYVRHHLSKSHLLEAV